MINRSATILRTENVEDVLAEVVIVSSGLALTKENGHHLSHVNAEESVKIANDSRQRRQRHCFNDWQVDKVFAAEGRKLHVEFDHESAI